MLSTPTALQPRQFHYRVKPPKENSIIYEGITNPIMARQTAVRKTLNPKSDPIFFRPRPSPAHRCPDPYLRITNEFRG